MWPDEARSGCTGPGVQSPFDHLPIHSLFLVKQNLYYRILTIKLVNEKRNYNGDYRLGEQKNVCAGSEVSFDGHVGEWTGIESPPTATVPIPLFYIVVSPKPTPLSDGKGTPKLHVKCFSILNPSRRHESTMSSTSRRNIKG